MAKEKLVASPSAKQGEPTRITYVITQLCIGTKDASYVDVSQLTLGALARRKPRFFNPW